MSNKNAFVFIGGNKILEGLYISHNVNFLKNLIKSKQLDCQDFYMLGYASDELYEGRGPEIDAINQEIISFASHHGCNLSYRRIPKRDMKSVNITVEYLKSELKDYNKIIIWNHNLYGAVIANRLKKYLMNIYIHADLKGIAPEEELNYSNAALPSRFLKYLALKYIEKTVLPKVDSISVVSDRFAERISKITNLPLDSIYSIPSVYYEDQFYADDDIRQEYRKKLGVLDNEKLVFYSGGLQKYQSVENIFKFFKKIEEMNGIRTLLLLSDEAIKMGLSEKYGLNNTITMTATGKDVNGYYNAADIGVAFRSEDAVSQVSCPTKIPEYIATRNSVILHKNIGDFGNILQNKEFADVRQGNQDILDMSIDEILSLRPPNDDEMDIFSKRYSITESMKKNEELFERLNSSFAK
jgi:glycosyltransferase involved in cell wall biosynthesis